MSDLKRNPAKIFRRDTHPELPLDPDVVRPGIYKWPLGLRPAFIAMVFVGGVFGTLGRYGVAVILPARTDHWPTATLAVNLIGAFLLGVLLEALARRGPDEGARRSIRLAAGTGFMGAFTTYSTFAADATLLMKHGRYAIALAYLAVTIIGGLSCSALGIQMAAAHHKRLQVPE